MSTPLKWQLENDNIPLMAASNLIYNTLTTHQKRGLKVEIANSVIIIAYN